MKPLNLTAETWKNVKYLDGYKISNHGRLRHGDTILKPGKDINGTLTVTAIHKDGYRTHVRIARLVGEAFSSTYRPDLRPVYRNGDRSDCRPSNIQWVPIHKVTGAPYSRNSKP